MKKMMLVLFCLLLSATFANATLLTNGDFENPNLSGGWQVYSSIPGWDTITGPGIEIQTSGVVVNAQSGDQYVELDSHSNSVMAQDVSLNSGTYVLDFWYQPRTNWDGNSNGIYYGIQGLQTASIGGKKNEFNGWTQFSMTIDILTTGLYNVVFGAEGTSDSYGGFIDNVSLNPAPVPEPATILLLGSGLVGLAWYGRKRKNQ